MFDKNIRQICINVYNQLSKYNIKGIKKNIKDKLNVSLSYKDILCI